MPTEFKVDDIIVQIQSDEAEVNPFVFGKGEEANVKFSDSNEYIAKK